MDGVSPACVSPLHVLPLLFLSINLTGSERVGIRDKIVAATIFSDNECNYLRGRGRRLQFPTRFQDFTHTSLIVAAAVAVNYQGVYTRRLFRSRLILDRSREDGTESSVRSISRPGRHVSLDKVPD